MERIQLFLKLGFNVGFSKNEHRGYACYAQAKFNINCVLRLMPSDRRNVIVQPRNVTEQLHLGTSSRNATEVGYLDGVVPRVESLGQ